MCECVKTSVLGVQWSEEHLGCLHRDRLCLKQKLAHTKGLLPDLGFLVSSHSVNNP